MDIMTISGKSPALIAVASGWASSGAADAASELPCRPSCNKSNQKPLTCAAVGAAGGASAAAWALLIVCCGSLLIVVGHLIAVVVNDVVRGSHER